MKTDNKVLKAAFTPFVSLPDSLPGFRRLSNDELAALKIHAKAGNSALITAFILFVAIAAWLTPPDVFSLNNPIPSLFAFVILIAGFYAAIFVSKQARSALTDASPDEVKRFMNLLLDAPDSAPMCQLRGYTHSHFCTLREQGRVPVAREMMLLHEAYQEAREDESDAMKTMKYWQNLESALPLSTLEDAARR